MSAYTSPLAQRYASAAMVALWSDESRHRLWRELWVALARIEHQLGAAITADQVAALERALPGAIDYERVRERERETRHDVMAHLHVFGEMAPSARGILHLGATSCYVTDNSDLILMRRGLERVATSTAAVIARLARFAAAHRARPTLAFTHLQPAQPTTVGKRACLWIFDFLLTLEEVERLAAALLLRGAKGTTGTQASFLAVLGSADKVAELEARLAAAFSFPGTYPVTGQTYSRLIDAQVLGALTLVAQAAARLANDVRMLSHLREVEEPSESTQVGSSAMPYKRNPMRSERINSLARYLVNLAANAPDTAMAQFFERTLDDSANRRLAIPESFLAADAILRLAANVSRGLVVHPAVIERRLAVESPFMATEGIMMAAVAAGGDRQALHERIRVHSRAAAERVHSGDGHNDLLARLAADPAFAALGERLALLGAPAEMVGLAPRQVDEFLAGPVAAALARYPLGEQGCDDRIEV